MDEQAVPLGDGEIHATEQPDTSRCLHVQAPHLNAGLAEDALDEMADQLDEVEGVLEDREGVDDLKADVEAMRERLDALAEALDDASDGAGVWGRIEGFSGPPTADAMWSIDRSWEQVPGVVDDINGVIRTEMPALLRRVYVGAVVPTVDPVTMPARGG